MSRNIMRKIIADTSSLILLYKCGAAEYFLNTCCCIVPQPVRDELTAAGHEGADFFEECIIKKIFAVKIHSVDFEPVKKLHKGESGAIALYREGAGDYLIIDDGGGAAYCRDNGIPYINALLAVKILFSCGKIDQKKYDTMFMWLKSNGRYSKAVIEWAENSGIAELSAFLL
ncbi:MAG TPA: hypothetical protein PK293_12250 [Spirochaetota bacterium]|nr:hypothetical protein [Spirochaetota bacterium]HPJ43139.1 hypothetical protein [Spirochaetota bacterium]